MSVVIVSLTPFICLSVYLSVSLSLSKTHTTHSHHVSLHSRTLSLSLSLEILNKSINLTPTRKHAHTHTHTHTPHTQNHTILRQHWSIYCNSTSAYVTVHCRNSVSYTHLDVYKRQTYKWVVKQYFLGNIRLYTRVMASTLSLPLLFG